MSMTLEEKRAKLEAQLANLDHKIAVESNPRVKEIEGSLSVKLKAVGELRKRYAQTSRIIETATRKVEELQARIDEAKEVQETFNPKLDALKATYNQLATEQEEILGGHVDRLETILDRRDEMKQKSSAPDEV